jgi:hypothetical protein
VINNRGRATWPPIRSLASRTSQWTSLKLSPAGANALSYDFQAPGLYGKCGFQRIRQTDGLSSISRYVAGSDWTPELPWLAQHRKDRLARPRLDDTELLNCRTPTSAPAHWINVNQRQKPVWLGWLKRGHLRDKIEYLCESRRGHALSKKVGDPRLVGMDTRRKPDGKPFVALHSQNAPAVKTGPGVEPDKGGEMPQVLVWLWEHPSRWGIVAEG